jgi:hypothetical protein
MTKYVGHFLVYWATAVWVQVEGDGGTSDQAVAVCIIFEPHDSLVGFSSLQSQAFCAKQ